MIAPTVVIGLGNPLLGDEGIGIRVVHELQRDPRLPPGADVLDLGTSGMAVLHAIAGRRRAIIVDCAFMKEEPGAIRRFLPGDVRSAGTRDAFSLHEGDLLGMLELSCRLGECPAEVVLFGIQPASIAPGMNLSPALSARLPEYVSAVLREMSAQPAP